MSFGWRININALIQNLVSCHGIEKHNDKLRWNGIVLCDLQTSGGPELNLLLHASPFHQSQFLYYLGPIAAELG